MLVKLALSGCALVVAAAASIVIYGHGGPGRARPATAEPPGATAPRLVRAIPVPGPAQVAFNQRGTALAAAGNDGTIRVWNTATWKVTASVRASDYQWLAWDPRSGELAIAYAGIRLWDPVTGATRTLAPAGQDGPVAFSPDGRTLAVAVSDPHLQKPEVIQLWNTSTWTPAKVLTSADSKFGSLAFSPDGRLLAAGGQAGGILAPPDGAGTDVWDVSSGRIAARFLSPQHPDPDGFGINSTDNAVAFSPDGMILATGRELPAETPVYTGIRLWDVSSRTMTTQLAKGGGGSVTFSPDGTTLAAVNAYGTSVQLWTIKSRTARTIPLPTNPGGTPPFSEISTLAYSPDGRDLAVPLNDTIQIWAVSPAR